MTTPQKTQKGSAKTTRRTAATAAPAPTTAAARGTNRHDRLIDHAYLNDDQFQIVGELLQRNTATMISLYLKAKKCHWDVRGRFFRELHLMFDEVAELAIASVDELAERLVQLGGSPVASPATLQRDSSVTVPEDTVHDPRALLETLVEDLVNIGRSLRDDSESADEANDPATADMLNGFLQAVDKQRWMLRATLDDEKLD